MQRIYLCMNASAPTNIDYQTQQPRLRQLKLFYFCFCLSPFQVMSMLYPKIVDMFYYAGDKHSTPNCPVELRPDLNPSSGIQSYDGSDPMCLKPAHYNIPFFLNRLGPKFSEWSINSHEARPGHHIQVSTGEAVITLWFVKANAMLPLRC